jgi:hypothetical protein
MMFLNCLSVIASEAKQSIAPQAEMWIASSRSLSSGAHSRDPLAPRNDRERVYPVSIGNDVSVAHSPIEPS